MNPLLQSRVLFPLLLHVHLQHLLYPTVNWDHLSYDVCHLNFLQGLFGVQYMASEFSLGFWVAGALWKVDGCGSTRWKYPAKPGREAGQLRWLPALIIMQPCDSNHHYYILGEVPSRTLSFLAESSIIKLCTRLKTIAMHKTRKKLMSVKSDRQVSVQFFFNFLTMWGTLKILNNLNSNH